MALSSYLLLLLVALSVSAVHKVLGGCLPQGKNPSMEFPLTFGRCGKERHSLYHTYSNHSNNWIMKSTVQFDGVEIYCFVQKRTGSWTYSHWGITMKDVDYTFRNYSKELYHHLKDTDSDLTQRYGCEVERSSSGAVTLLSTTAEFRLNGKIILRFNVDRDEWEVLDKRFLAVKTEWNSLTHSNQIIKDYLQQGCTDRLQSYLKFYDEDIRKRTSSVVPSDKPEDCDEGSTNSTQKGKKENEGKEGIVLFSVLSCIVIAGVAVAMAFALLMKKIAKGKVVIPPVKDAHRGYSDAGTISDPFVDRWCFMRGDVDDLLPLSVMMNDDQDGGDAVQTQKSFSSSREFLPPYMERFTASMDKLPPALERFTASMDLPRPDLERFTASMDLPRPNLAEDDDDDDDGQKLTQVRLTRTARLTTAGGQLRSTSISLPEFGSWNSRAIWV
ncbi:uncharacterized protein LOC118801028 isoform X2 [Colossoma macropomum]|uniref:uncharacterized protein LOC118801028 isoform X2 n=1 Tax=Colossoma macropomum TaxID=42526 RepID=UPI001863DF91|nr:uncharacterized protein LOC118801028 isoform X2 [Colossoma macropomum]